MVSSLFAILVKYSCMVRFTTGAANIALDVTSRGVNLLSNDHATYTKLNANINTVSANVEIRNTQLNANIDIVQDNVAVLGGGGTFFDPFMNVNTATGTSNVFFSGKDTIEDANVLTVTLDGVVQANTEFVMHHSNNTIQFKDASIPSGTIVTILSMMTLMRKYRQLTTELTFRCNAKCPACHRKNLFL